MSTFTIAEMFISGLRASAARMQESFGPGEQHEPVGSTTSGKTIEGRGHDCYSGALSGPSLTQKLHNWSAIDHREAAERHNLMAREADEHHEIFNGMYGDGADLAQEDQSRYLEMLQHLKAAAQLHREIAAAHAHASSLVPR